MLDIDRWSANLDKEVFEELLSYLKMETGRDVWFTDELEEGEKPTERAQERERHTQEIKSGQGRYIVI